MINSEIILGEFGEIIQGKNNKFGKNVMVLGKLKIGKNNHIGNNVVFSGNVTIGDGNFIGDFATIGSLPHHSRKKYEFSNEFLDGSLSIGDQNIFRNFITIDLPIETKTEIKNRNFFMSYIYIGHDSKIFNECILSSHVKLGGFTKINSSSNLGMGVSVHQFSTLGAFSMIGMNATVIKDHPPFLVSVGTPAVPKKINTYALQKGGFEEKHIRFIEKFYRNLTLGGKFTSELAHCPKQLKLFFVEFLNQRVESREMVDLSNINK